MRRSPAPTTMATRPTTRGSVCIIYRNPTPSPVAMSRSFAELNDRDPSVLYCVMVSGTAQRTHDALSFHVCCNLPVLCDAWSGNVFFLMAWQSSIAAQFKPASIAPDAPGIVEFYDDEQIITVGLPTKNVCPRGRLFSCVQIIPSALIEGNANCAVLTM